MSDFESEAIEFQSKHRLCHDVVYNPRRLAELPLPIIIENNNVDNQPEADHNDNLNAPMDVAELNGAAVEQEPNNNDVLIVPMDVAGPNGAAIEHETNNNDNLIVPMDVAEPNGAAVEQNPNNNDGAQADRAALNANGLDDDVVVIENIDIIVIDSGDDDDELADRKPNILAQVKIENRDLEAIQNILAARRTLSDDITAAGSANEPSIELATVQPTQIATADLVNAPSTSAAAVAVNELFNEGFFPGELPVPKKAKIEPDDFSGGIPFIKNVCASILLFLPEY